MLKEAFGEQALRQARTFVWFKRFKNGRESVEDDKHSGPDFRKFWVGSPIRRPSCKVPVIMVRF